jgi:curved DNA-binding protein CbpA
MADKVPHLVPGFDVKKLKLDPMDGFVFSRIDGRLGPRELARETGLPDFSVARALEKLERLGAVALVAPGAPPPAGPPSSAPTAPPPPSAIAAFETGFFAPKYDPAELEEPADLTPEQKKQILDFFYRLEDADHYTLLGVSRDADKKKIKRAYFELAATFHPDRYFKKQLGSFKAKMEAVFNRATEANDTLLDPANRAEYDAYLAEVATTRGMETMLERALADAARAAAEAAAHTAITAPPPPPPPPAVTAPPPPPAGPSPEELQRRREALARRLVGGARPLQASSPPPPPQQPSPLRYASAQDAVDALKRRYEERLSGATQAQAQRYRQAAEDALAKKDLVAASTAYTLAVKFAPEDEALAAKADEVKHQADLSVVDSYLKQAEYEEKQGHWTEAARSWEKVARIKNDASSNARAAQALLEAGGDLHLAADYAKQAIALAPHAIEHHVTLVEVYAKAGLTASARRAAEAASTLEPNNDKIQAVLKRLGK